MGSWFRRVSEVWGEIARGYSRDSGPLSSTSGLDSFSSLLNFGSTHSFLQLLVYRFRHREKDGGKLAVYQGELPEGMSRSSLPVNVKMPKRLFRETS
jgi:hypothetical protein